MPASTKKTNEFEAYLQSPEGAAQKAHSTGDIKFFLKHFLLFRAYIKFNNGKTIHLYGNEHQVTYQQCIHGRVPHILLEREKGYGDLVNYIEKRIKGKFVSASIYMRTAGELFNTQCRRYYRSDVPEECQDPVIPEEIKFKKLFFYTKQQILVITETDPANENFKIN